MATAEASPPARLRVLVVDDEYLVAVYTAMLLEDLGHEPIGPASTVAGAIAAIAGEHPDAVLLDANLGGESSGPVATELLVRHLPFVVVTGYGDMALTTPALQHAPRVNKPFTTTDIAAAISKMSPGLARD